jgi:hypothetical protein
MILGVIVDKHFRCLKILLHLENVSLIFNFSIERAKKLCDFS